MAAPFKFRLGWLGGAGEDAPLRETPTGLYKSNMPRSPEDELTADEWIRRREGRPTAAEEKAMREKAEAEKGKNIEKWMYELYQKQKQQQEQNALRAQQAQQISAAQMEARLRAQSSGMQNIFGQGFGQTSSFPYNITTSPFRSPFDFDDVVTKPKREAKPKAQVDTPEEAERKLTAIGQRKIIVDEDKK